MEFTKTRRTVLSSDEMHILKGTLYEPQCDIKDIRGFFHIVHGMTEYINRYDPLMSLLAKAGFICFGFDNLGHGETAENDSELGFIAHKNGWKYLVEDVKVFADAVRSEYPDMPYILMGHSMGSFIVRLNAEKYGDTIDKLVICGTAGPNPAAPLGLLLTDAARLFKGQKSISPFLESMVFGAYNKGFEGRTKYDWLTSDTEIIDKYMQDKLCTFHFTVSALHDLIKLNYMCNKKSWFENIRKDLPILLVAGAEDPVGGHGKGVNTVYKRLLKSGHGNVTLKLYKDCRHEIHNDVCKNDSAKDILTFAATH